MCYKFVCVRVLVASVRLLPCEEISMNNIYIKMNTNEKNNDSRVVHGIILWQVESHG